MAWCRLIVLIAVLIFGSAVGFAQYEEEGYEDEADYDIESEEPFDEPQPELDQSGPPLPRPPAPPPFVPKPNSDNNNSGNRPGGRSSSYTPPNTNRNRSNTAPNNSSATEEIKFKLIEPPKYWKPKKRKRSPQDFLE